MGLLRIKPVLQAWAAPYFRTFPRNISVFLTDGERIANMAHLHKHTVSSKEGVRWKCSQCGWESVPMYFGEVFEPEHLCPNEYCGCGHRRLEHKHDICAGAKIRGEGGNINQTQELCGCRSFQPK
jgi:hypothetical protein